VRVFAYLKTGIDGLDGVLAGGVRYPEDSAAFVCIAGGPGTGKTLLALEVIARAFLDGDDGATYLYYSVEHSPESLHKKIDSDFDWFRRGVQVTVLPREVPGKLVLEAKSRKGTSRLVITQARAAALQKQSARGTTVDIEWMLAEIQNTHLASPVAMVCIDNVGLLLTDLEYFEKRAALLEVRRQLLENRIHGIFVMEEASPRDLRLPSAEEFSTDLMLHLSFRDETADFKIRALEILKARHQYYYRGVHHFSIAGRGITRDVYLGARNERGPGIHVYPSVAAQLSMARDQAEFRVPRRGDRPIDLGHPDLAAAFQNRTGPATVSSTVLLAEPGTRGTFLALRFLAAGLRAGERAVLVSTREDRDAIRRICQRESVLAPSCLGDDGGFHPDFRVLYLHPEFISPGKFTWDILRLVQGGHGNQGDRPVSRLVFDNVFRLQDRFPLLQEQTFLIAALLDMLRYHLVTPLFVDMVPPGAGSGRVPLDPSSHLVSYDNVIQLMAAEGEQGTPRFRVLKSVGNDFLMTPQPIDWRKD
jgi:KaiC/GvpD/RAD55 family RecA-like ATPase